MRRHTLRLSFLFLALLWTLVCAVGVAADVGMDAQTRPASNRLRLADVATSISYQGLLTDGTGAPLDGAYDIMVSLYDDPLAGRSLHGGRDCTAGRG